MVEPGTTTIDLSPENLNRLRGSLRPLLGPHPVVLAYLYGSQAGGKATPLSDVDVALVMAEELDPRERLRLELTLETELSPVLGGALDVRVINDAPLAVKGSVVEMGVPIYVKDDGLRVDFEARVRDLYFDFLPVLRLHQSEYFSAQRLALRERGYL